MASSSLHYSGYAIGYLLWGYLILFEVIVIITVIIKFLTKFYFITENIAKVLLPITTIFLFKRIIIWYLSRFFLTNSKPNRGFLLRNHKLYFILNHFNFFFDCFLGSFVCFVRMAKSSVAALFFMPRLDYSIFGRYLERTDMGFISYVTFIHMDVNQSHPVKSAFCDLLNKAIKKPNENSARQQMNRRIRNKWLLAITLHRNPGLKKSRKHYLLYLSKIQKVETFEQFLERRVKIFFGSDGGGKKRSRSTPNLLEERDGNKMSSKNFQSLNNEQVVGLDYEQRTSTVNFRNDVNNVVFGLQNAEVKRQMFSGSHYENERFVGGELILNTTIGTNDTILNYTDEYSPKSNRD